MDFKDSTEEAAFRDEIRRWLDINASLKVVHPSRATSLGAEPSVVDEDVWVEATRDWQRAKHEAGYAAIRWPIEWGGPGGTVVQAAIFAEEEARYDVALGTFTITMGMVGPTIGTHGTAEQRQHLGAMLRGKEIWCQMFSEPGAGSDLASIETSATRDDDEWTINGQKVWTSGAHYADWAYLLARSDPSVPKHRGLTAFILPMDTPGVTVRPLRTMTGEAPFNEIFLDDVRIPDRYRLGDVGAGWKVATSTLMNERFAASQAADGGATFRAVAALVRATDSGGDPLVRQETARLYTDLEVQRLTIARAVSAAAQGREPGPEGSVLKVLSARIPGRVTSLSEHLLGADGMLEGDWIRLLLRSPGARLGGGTDEIQKNIIGERVLGLPGEPRVDGGPFADRLRSSGGERRADGRR